MDSFLLNKMNSDDESTNSYEESENISKFNEIYLKMNSNDNDKNEKNKNFSVDKNNIFDDSKMKDSVSPKLLKSKNRNNTEIFRNELNGFVK